MQSLVRAAGFSLASLVFLAGSCTGGEDPGDPAGPGAQKVLARVDGEPITAEEVDGPLRLALHDLEQSRYALRRRRLDRLIAARLGGASAEGRVEILLAAPEPPRVALPVQGAPIRGAREAPVTIIEFIDYQSAHCRRMQPVLRQVLDAYQGDVRLAVRDLPLPFHRHARLAAEAARCAGEQARYWDYHDVLLKEQPDLARDALERYARRLGLDTEAFAACLDSGRHEAAVTADERLAQRIGVRTTPTFFVNGAYLKGRQSFAELARRIDDELGRPHDPPPTPEPGAPRALHDAIDAFRTAPESDPPTPPGPPQPPEEIPEPEVVVNLPRAEVSRALRERPRLEAEMQRSERTFDGVRLLAVDHVRPGGLFDLLGLDPRDVLILVDGQWVTDAHNPLWAALEEGSPVTLTVMRRGLPRTFRYVIE